MSTLKPASQRVQEYLSGYGLEFVVQELPASTRTAVEAASAIGCEVDQIAKSIIFQDAASTDPILVVASGTNMVCTDKIESASGIKLKKADAAYVRDRLGYVIGGVPPVAHSVKVRTFLDPDLKKWETIWAAAGTPNSVFQLNCSKLEEITQGEWVNLARQ